MRFGSFSDLLIVSLGYFTRTASGQSFCRKKNHHGGNLRKKSEAIFQILIQRWRLK
jgi:hypothetical protein